MGVGFMGLRSYKLREGKDLLPEEDWLVFEPMRSKMSDEELSWCEVAEFFRKESVKLDRALRETLMQTCTRRPRDDGYDEGEAPIDAHNNEVFESALEVLGLKDGDPEYRLWPQEMLDNWGE